MTTCVFSKPLRTIAADTQNTLNGVKWRTRKIERLPDGRVFLGSGHSFTIAQARGWAMSNWKDAPDWSYLDEDEDDRGFECLVISQDGKKVWHVDSAERFPNEVDGDHFAVGSGAAYALGALAAGADPVRAIEIAADHDPNTSAPIDSYTFGEKHGED